MGVGVGFVSAMSLAVHSAAAATTPTAKVPPAASHMWADGGSWCSGSVPSKSSSARTGERGAEGVEVGVRNGTAGGRGVAVEMRRVAATAHNLRAVALGKLERYDDSLAESTMAMAMDPGTGTCACLLACVVRGGFVCVRCPQPLAVTSHPTN